MGYKTINPDLHSIKSGWLGNPLDKSGKYRNMDGPSERSFMDFMKWQFTPNRYREQKKNQVSNIVVNNDELFLHTYREGFTWLGHASFLFQVSGRRIITDPVFYDLGPLKRYTEFPCQPEHLEAIDYILLSHNHRDHCDEKSMKLLCERNPDAVILTGLQIEPLLREWEISNEVIEAGWYQQYFNHKHLTITYLPARHWNRRYLHDLNTMLWGSFMIETPYHTLYFGADSGMGSHFGEIGDMFPDIDYAFLGIGAYEPVWFMHPSHTSPEDVLYVMRLLHAKHLIPMHHGTFDLGDEPIFNPREELLSLSRSKLPFHIHFLEIGSMFFLD